MGDAAATSEEILEIVLTPFTPAWAETHGIGWPLTYRFAVRPDSMAATDPLAALRAVARVESDGCATWTMVLENVSADGLAAVGLRQLPPADQRFVLDLDDTP